jgi:hypothetical protein
MFSWFTSRRVNTKRGERDANSVKRNGGDNAEAEPVVVKEAE